VILYVIYKAISWAADKYGWESIAIVFSIITIIIVTIYACKVIWEGANSLIEKGKTYVKFGMVWFVSIFIISILIDLLFAYYSQNGSWSKGAGIFLITTFMNMPGTSILFFIGAKKLRSCELIENRVREGRKIVYFGVFWFFFWIITPILLVQSNVMTNDIGMLIALVVTIPGTIANIIIGKWSSRVDLKKGWEYLDDAQKTLNIEKDILKRQQEDIQNKKNQIEEQQTEIQKQQTDAQKQLKDLQKLKKDILKEKKELEKQQKDIQSARSSLETTWNELENVIENPFPFLLKKRLHKEVFIEEINQLKKARPGDVSSIETNADKVILDIKEKLKIEIINIEDQYYHEAFLEYFKNNGHDLAEYDRIRIKYNPTIHTTERRNREWAEKRRFELSKIEKFKK
jgi:hypothetical protein